MMTQKKRRKCRGQPARVASFFLFEVTDFSLVARSIAASSWFFKKNFFFPRRFRRKTQRERKNFVKVDTQFFWSFVRRQLAHITTITLL